MLLCVFFCQFVLLCFWSLATSKFNSSWQTDKQVKELMQFWAGSLAKQSPQLRRWWWFHAGFAGWTPFGVLYEQGTGELEYLGCVGPENAKGSLNPYFGNAGYQWCCSFHLYSLINPQIRNVIVFRAPGLAGDDNVPQEPLAETRFISPHLVGIKLLGIN